LLGGEIYSGWLTHWGENWQGKNIENYTNEFNFLMRNNHSFSMYMAHGGTNFGLTAGANGFDKKPFDYGGHVTSYDYDAPINEQGSPNNKYHIFR
jgi:beta-galactosidase